MDGQLSGNPRATVFEIILIKTSWKKVMANHFPFFYQENIVDTSGVSRNQGSHVRDFI